MFDLNGKTAFLIVVLAVGGAFELIKSLPVKASSNWSLDGLRLGSESSPYNVKAGRVAGHSQLPRVAYKAPQTGGIDLAAQMQKFAAANAPVATDVVAPKGPAVEKGAEGVEDYEIYIDPKTGKMMKKKKKKKKDAKKKDEDKKEEVAAVEELPETEPKREEAQPQSEIVYAQAPAQAQNQQQAKKQPGIGSFEDWMARLLEKPDAKETRKFIQAYHNSMVTASVYYKIVDLMVADQRIEMKQLGVLCLSQAPSVHSFEVLARIQEHETASSTLAASVNRALDQYAQLESLSILEKVLSSDSGYSTIMAARKVDASARQNLTGGNAGQSAPNPSADETNPEVVLVSQNAQYYTRFIDILTGLVNTSQDHAVVSEAQNTLNSLQNLLQPSQITASAN